MSSPETEPRHDAITYCYTRDDCHLHRAQSPYGLMWNAMCGKLCESLPEGLKPSTPTLIRCRFCFPPVDAQPFAKPT